MALIPLLGLEHMTTDQQDTAQRVIGRVLNFHKLVAHSPAALTGFLALSTAMKEMKLNRKLRELAYLRTAQLNRCQY